MKFDYIFGNPPFQDSKNRNKTQHKLWIEFTEKYFSRYLNNEGEMLWITPSSWGSPSNKIFKIFKKCEVKYLNLDIENFFSNIGSTFSYYHLNKVDDSNSVTDVEKAGKHFTLKIDEDIKYFPIDFCNESISIHQKVMFAKEAKFEVHHDYTTCHNVIRHAKKILAKKMDKIKGDILMASDDNIKQRKLEKLNKYQDDMKNCVITLSEEQTDTHIYPVFHTNKKIWYSSVKQDFSDKKKVMWTRSGYTKPFYDDGHLGCTDMGYYILVNTKAEGRRLEAFLTSKLMSYIFKTAKWSGFGNEIVFSSIPKIDLTRDMQDKDYYKLFSLSKDEINYIENASIKTKKRKSRSKNAEIKDSSRKKNLGEVYTPRELVLQMLRRLSDEQWRSTDSTFIDPSCGTGNFLVEIVNKKIAAGLSPFQAAKTTYGVDIMQDNIDECRARIFDATKTLVPEKQHLELARIISSNIKCGNGLADSLENIFIKNGSKE
jgi:hypothetical protein